MTPHKAAELISLSLTVPTVLLGSLVVVIWGKSSIKALRATRKTATDWLILGIVVSFVGSSLDNIYWGITWGSDLLGFQSSATWFRNGVYANIPLRQTAGIIAAFCHLRGAISWSSKGLPDGLVNRIITASWVLCAITLLALYQFL